MLFVSMVRDKGTIEMTHLIRFHINEALEVDKEYISFCELSPTMSNFTSEVKDIYTI